MTLEVNLAHGEKRCAKYIERRVAGVFFVPYEFFPAREKVNLRIIEQLRRSGIAAVLLDRDLTAYPERTEFDLVAVDNFAGGYQIADHLLKLGVRRLLFVQRPHSAPPVDARSAGVREAARRAGIDLPDNFVRIGLPDDPRFIGELIAEPRPDALVCANDATAVALMRQLQLASVRIPADIRVVGFDDVAFARLTSPPLTTMQQPCREIGDVAFRTMLERIAEPNAPVRTVSLTPTLIVRESCGAYLRR